MKKHETLFIGNHGMIKPFILAKPETSGPIMFVGTNGMVKPVIFADPKTGTVVEKMEGYESTSSMPSEILAKKEKTKSNTVVEHTKMEPQRPVTWETLMAPNITHEAPKQDMNSFTPSHAQIPGMYSCQWQQDIASYGNQTNSIPVAGQQSIATENQVNIEAQPSVTDGMHYTDQLCRIQQLQQTFLETSGAVSAAQDSF